MICPDCQNGDLADASAEFGDEEGESGWVKCFRCGWRGKEATTGKLVRFTRTTITSASARTVEVQPSARATPKEEKTMPKTTEKAESAGTRCSKPNCYTEAAEDSVRCVKHRDEQRASNEAYKKKLGKQSSVTKTGKTRGPYKKKDTQPAAAMVTETPTDIYKQPEPTDPMDTDAEVSWTAWQSNMIEQLGQAEEVLKAKLAKVQTAMGVIRAL